MDEKFICQVAWLKPVTRARVSTNSTKLLFQLNFSETAPSGVRFLYCADLRRSPLTRIHFCGVGNFAFGWFTAASPLRARFYFSPAMKRFPNDSV